MKFRHKILLSIWGVVLSLLVITFFIVNYWTRSRIEDTFSQELRSNRSTLDGIVGLEAEILLRGCQVIAESPRLRAVVELQDSKTAYQLSRELTQTAASDLFAVTGRTGGPLVQIVFGRNEPSNLINKESVLRALSGTPATGVWMVGSRIFRVASVPIAVDRDIVGSLTLGFAITENELSRLKQWTNKSEILLAQRDKILLSTLGEQEHKNLVAAIGSTGLLNPVHGQDSAGQVFRVKVSDDIYLGISYQFGDERSRDGIVQYFIVKATDRELSASLRPVLGTFGIVSLIFLVLTTLIGYAVARGITQPIHALVQGTTEISRGNYDYMIRIVGKDEVSVLAQHFGEMSRSLKEKISELGRLNQDLIGRNEALDETLRKLKEAQEELVKSERLAATGKLTAQLAHEINNPVHNIQSCLKSSLGRLPGEAQGRELVEVAYEEVVRMSKLTRQLLDFYRTSFVPEEMHPLELNRVIDHVLAASGAELQKAGIAVERSGGSSSLWIVGSVDKLKQVFLNIVLNAKDAMPGGGVLTVMSEGAHGTAKVSIGDTGIGIPKENIGRVFDAFFTTKKNVSGVGLGLSVSYGIVNQHRGTISVESTPGRGSTFTILLPLLQNHPDSISN